MMEAIRVVRIEKITNVGDASRYEIVTTDGKARRFIVSNAEIAVAGNELPGLARAIAAIGRDVKASSKHG